MQIRTLHLRNFRSHVDTRLTLAPLTVIRGTNAAGKSSIEQALEIILGSRADGTTADGKGSSALIRAGQTKASIDISIMGANRQVLVKGALQDGRRALVATDPADPQWTGAAEFLDHISSDREVLSCLLNNRRFVDKSPDEQRAVLAAIILPRTYAWPDWVVPATADIEEPIDWSRTPFQIIAQAHELAFKARTNVNRDLKNFRLPEGDTAPAAHLEEHTSHLADLSSQLENLVAGVASRRSAEQGTQKTRAHAQTRFNEASSRLSREEQNISTLEASLLSPAKAKELEKVEKNKARATQLDKEIVEFDAAIATNRATFAKLNEFSAQPQCPTCASAITPEMVAALLRPVAEDRRRLDDSRAACIDGRKKLGNPEEAEMLLNAHRQASKDLLAAQRRASEERVTVEDAQNKLDELGNLAPADYSAEESNIADLREQVSKATVLVASARAAKDLQTRIATAETQRGELIKRQQVLEKLVNYFGDGPEGVKAELLAQKAGPFVEAMNRVLSAWGYTCHLTIEPYSFMLLFENGSGNSPAPHVPISIRHLSKSQRYRFAAAFQVALAIFSGYRVVCLDEADIYDADGRAGLYESLEAHLATGELDQAIILATDERETIPNVPNAVFYRLDDAAEPGHIACTTVRQLKPAPAEKAA